MPNKIIELDKIDKILDEDMKEAYNMYVLSLKENFTNHILKSLNVLSRLIKDIKLTDLDWKMSLILLNRQIYNNNFGINLVIFKFIYFLIDNGLYYGDFLYEYKENRDDFCRFIEGGFINKMELLQRKNVNPGSFIIFRAHIVASYRVVTIQKPAYELTSMIRGYLNDNTDIMNQNGKRTNNVKMFNMLIESLENKFDVNSIKDFSDETFFQSFNYMKDRLNDYELRSLIKFYIYIYRNMDFETRLKNFYLIDQTVLKSNQIIKYLKECYKIVNYNIYEKCPKYNRMIIKENNMDLNSTLPKDKFVLFENDFIENEKLQEYYSEFFWNDNKVTLLCRRKYYSPIRKFLIQLDNKYKMDDISIDVHDIIEMKKKVMSKKDSDNSKSKSFGAIKSFVKYIESNKNVAVEPIIYRLLVHKDSKNRDNREAYSKEEIKLIQEAFLEKCEEEENQNYKLLYLLYYFALLMFSSTEIRLSSILALTTDSLQKTLTRKGSNEYKLVVNSKSVKDERDEYNITHYVKRIYDEVLNATKTPRENAPYPEKDYLFIYKRSVKEAIACLRQGSFTEYLKSICKGRSIRYLTTAGIRNYYQQNVTKYVTDKNYDISLIEKLGKHTVDVHFSYYDKVDITEFCQRFYETEIGSVHLKGRVEIKNNSSDESIVNGGCGHCMLESCNLKGKLGCMMCDNFITTLDCIPYLEIEIKLIDEEIIAEKLKHEKEFLFSKKKLLVAYLAKLMELEREVKSNEKKSSN